MLIVIDGYNFIFNVPELEKHVRAKHIEHLRDYVVSLFTKYRGKKHYDVILVFDGNYTEASLPKKQTLSGITVIYSKTGISADTEIKNITDLCQNPKDVCIVTYDNDIKRHVRKCGCRIIEPAAMYKEILDALNENKERKSDEPEYKQSGPSENDAKYWKDVFKELPKEEIKADMINAKMPKAKKKGVRSNIKGEPPSKYYGPSADESQYWLRVFKGIGKDEHQD